MILAADIPSWISSIAAVIAVGLAIWKEFGKRGTTEPWMWWSAAGVLVVVALVFLVLANTGSNASEADPGWLGDDADGKIVYCSGTDVSKSQGRSVDDYNGSSASGTSRARLVDDFSQAKTADGQREEYLKKVKKGDCDVVYLDIVYTPEFASKQLLRDMTEYVEGRGVENFDDKMMQTVEYDDKLWAIPKQLDGGVLYQRYVDGPAKEPESWQEVLRRSVPRPGEKPGLRVQLDAYEGLTVVFLELALAAGADPIVSDDGASANVDQVETLAALQFMRDAIRLRAVPKKVTSQGDDGSFYAFSVGRAKFLRSWPYVETQLGFEARAAEGRGSATAQARRRTADNHGVVPLPPWQPGDRRVGVLGGHNLVIPRSSKNPEGALHLIEFLTSEEQILRDAERASLAPVLNDLWTRPEVRDNPALSAVDEMEFELRPVIPRYAQVSRAIYSALRRVLSNEASDERLRDTLQTIQNDVQAVLDRP